MMKSILILVTSYLFVFSAFGQGEQPFGNGNEEFVEKRMESKKIAFLTARLDLSPEEAQVFWPVYNEYHKKKKGFREESRSQEEKDILTDDEAGAMLDKVFEREQKELDLKKVYFQKLKKVLPISKVAKLYIIEKDFRIELFKSIKKRMKRRKKEFKRKGKGF